MVTATKALFQYPKEIEKDFVHSKGIHFSDGSYITAEEIWKFMTEEAPRRFPYAFDLSANNMGRISEDYTFFGGIKRSYLSLSFKDRLLKAHARGVPIALAQGGQTMDTYYAAGAIPLRPGNIIAWARNMEEGLGLRQNDFRGNQILESGRNVISMEACNQIAAHAAIDNGVVPIDIVAPYLCLRCSDMSFLTESHRNRPHRKSLAVVDHPVEQAGKPWAADLMAAELRNLVKQIGKLSGKTVTDEEFFRIIRIGNKARRLVRETAELWWSAKVPPTNSSDFMSLSGIANDLIGDPVATTDVLEQIRDEVKERVEKGIKGFGLADRPKRLLICGSCVGPNSFQVEQAGAVLVGRDDNWSCVTVDIQETGDPYVNTAESILAYPYELPTEARADWTVNLVKQARAEGVIFMYNWGCNYQTSIARMVSDIVKGKAGVPTTFIEVGELSRSEGTEQLANRVESFIEML